VLTADYKFLTVDIGAQGRHATGDIFKNSEIGRRFSEGLMNLSSSSLPIELIYYETIPRAKYKCRKKNIQL